MKTPTLGNPQNTIEILQKYNFNFQKKFGQNFLIDEHVLDKIIRAAEITKDDYVLEIGPGIGTMTQYLACAAREVTAVEIDRALIPILEDTLKEYDNVSIINEDILKVDIAALAKEKNGGRPIKVVANLPYYITTPIIMGLFESHVPLESITVMVQKVEADSMQVGPGTKDYGALSLAVQYYARPKIVLNVPASCFMPRPNVDSAVIKLERYQKPPVEVLDEHLMFKIIRASFNQRRKTMMNSVGNSGEVNVSKEELQKIYDEIVEAFENTEVEGKKIPLKVSAGAIFMEPYMKETNAVRSRLTYALSHSRLEHHGELVIFNDEVCGSDENQFELIGVIHQCATHNFEGFRMFYQPIADTKTGKIRGMEALLRWELEPYGMVSPGVFMEWLEQDPCIFDLGNWILRTALTDVQKLRKETEGFFVNVNVAAAQLERREFRSAVMNILKETGAKPEELCLELTERCRDLDIHFLRGEVEFFHSQGIKIALDDFGTGNSSLSLALELPFDELKVDMSFIRDIKQKPQNQAMVQSIVDYAKRTNTEICIEGIENKEVSDYIEQFGATWQQGYYYSKPVPIDRFEEVLHKKATEKE